MKHVHFIGIGGTGLSAIATVLLERGLVVSGSDRQPSPQLQRLQAAGARVMLGHHAENILGADVIVRSSAVQDDNPEVAAARQAGVPVLKRADFLERLIDRQPAIAVAGTHGKTTTTAMIAWTLTALGADPSCVIGGVATNLGTNARAGAGPYFVIEADEYDRMFLGLRPEVAVVTNIEHDHPDCYPSPEAFYAAFRQFAGQIRPGGVLIACGEDPGARRLLAEMAAEAVATLTYGIGSGYDFAAHNLALNAAGGFDCKVPVAGQSVKLALQVPGEHNVRNALAALAVVGRIGLPLDEAAQALSEFRGAGRRFELRGEVNAIALVDDYAHHPTEIRATLAAARRRFAGRRVWAVWQPHTYSRTRTLQADFVAAFDDADCVLVTEVYPAREPAPSDSFSAAVLADQISGRRSATGGPDMCIHFAAGLDDAGDLLLQSVRPGDVVIVLSAGDADRITARLLSELPQRRNPRSASDDQD